jgi:hypothetical protein
MQISMQMMQICIPGLLPSLVLAGCASAPIGGRATAQYSKPAMTLAPLVLSPMPSPLPSHPPEAGNSQAWILGKWETVEGRSGRVDGVGEFEFRQEGSGLKWRMVRSGWFSGVHTTQTASGSVRRISTSSVELSGQYESSNLGNVAGTPVRHSFTRTGSSLRGYEAASDGTESLLALKRAQ